MENFIKSGTINAILFLTFEEDSWENLRITGKETFTLHIEVQHYKEARILPCVLKQLKE